MQNKFAQVRFHDEKTVKPIRLHDKGLPLPTQRKFKDGGQMIAPATIARAGVMEYFAGEAGPLFSDMDPKAIIKIMTREEDLFCKDSLESYRSAPITIGHPADDVTIENAKELQHGHLDGIPFADGELLAAQIVLSDIEGINRVETGDEDLSSGHDCTLVRLSDADAIALGYHAYKTNIRCNHVAIVPRGRAGSARIADSETVPPVETAETAKVTMYDQAFVSGLEAQLAAAQEAHEATKVKLADAISQVSPEAINTLIEGRLAFLAGAAKFTDVDLSKLSEVEAMRVVLKDACGRDYFGRDENFIKVRYAILQEEGAPENAETDISLALRDNAIHVNKEPVHTTPVADARQRMIDLHSGKDKK